MNQQREVIYSLRSFALEGGEELKGRGAEDGRARRSDRVETVLAELRGRVGFDCCGRTVMHYMLH
jgi:preprotein translocase subunit SecA